MDALGNPLVLGVLRCLDSAVELLEGADDDESEHADRFKAAHEACRRAMHLLERAVEYAETQPAQRG